MSEVINEIVKLEEGEPYIPDGETYAITENRSINDILRLMLKFCQNDKSEIQYLLDTIEISETDDENKNDSK